jgi:putative hydrolase of the HAD superfamily
MHPDRTPLSTGRQAIPLRGLLVDWGGVLTPPLDDTMAAWARRDGVDFEHFRAILAEWVGAGPPGAPGTVVGGDGPDGDLAHGTPPVGSPIHRLERGELESATFERELAAALALRGSTVGHEGLLGRMLEGLATLDASMIGLVRRAHAAGVRTALLSNSWGDHYPDELWDGLFDAVVISGRVGMRKPEPRIFRHAAQALGLEPSSCVMVDDLPRNIRAAVGTGMAGVLHRSYEETRAELAVLLALPDDPAGA